jgi:hypothetical protein
LRASALWFALHFFLLVITGFGSLRIPLASVLILAAMTGALGFIDARRRNELLFLQNLGIAPSMVVGTWVITVVILEIAIRFVAVAAGV